MHRTQFFYNNHDNFLEIQNKYAKYKFNYKTNKTIKLTI